MRLAILGGGGFRVPLVLRALARRPELAVDEIVLQDVAADRLATIRAVVGDLPGLRSTTDLADAVAGADVVFSAFRVGGAPERVRDERRAIRHGLLGQETVGAGGLCYALRTLPVALRVAEVVRRESDAWLVNFTNPAGMVTEASRTALGDRVVGICDSPTGLVRRVGRVLGVGGTGGIGRTAGTADYVGINHLGWLRGYVVDGADRLPSLLAADDLLQRFEEGRLFGGPLLRALGAVPNEYLTYYYGAREARAAQQERTRGEELLADQAEFFAGPAADAAHRWEAARRRREEGYLAEARTAGRDEADLAGGGYEDVALDVMAALTGHGDADLIVDTVNGDAVPGLPADAVVEVRSRVSPAGARSLPVAAPDLHQLGLLAAVKDAERAAVAAVLHRDRISAERAFALHPLVDSARAGRAVLADLIAEDEAVAGLFGA